MPLPGRQSRGIGGSSPQEVAAVVAVIALLDADQRRLAATAAAEDPAGAPLDPWVLASRLRGRRATLDRGPWRLASRLGSRRTS